jgi:phospho-N-acetylmuramoyl-pentapeptide-transferase
MSSEFFQIVRALIIGSISFAIAMMFQPVMYKVLLKIGKGKQIRTEGAPIFASLHSKKEGTPTMGGIMIWGTVFFVITFIFILSKYFGTFWDWLNFLSRKQTLLPLGAFLFSALIGLFDDILGVLRIGGGGGGLRIKEKVLLYILVASCGAWWFYSKLGFREIHIPFWGDINLGFWYVPFFIFVVVSALFSMNETDGLDGLAAGVSLSAYGALGVVAFIQGRFDLAVFVASILGALLAFLWYNIYPAKFFMGDTGSMALGTGIGVISMLTNTSLLLPFFASILVIESLSVIVQKAYKILFKEKLFLSTPIHHHFEAMGINEASITMRFWIISALSASLGLVIFFLDRLLSG